MWFNYRLLKGREADQKMSTINNFLNYKGNNPESTLIKSFNISETEYCSLRVKKKICSFSKSETMKEMHIKKNIKTPIKYTQIPLKLKNHVLRIDSINLTGNNTKIKQRRFKTDYSNKPAKSLQSRATDRWLVSKIRQHTLIENISSRFQANGQRVGLSVKSRQFDSKLRPKTNNSRPETAKVKQSKKFSFFQKKRTKAKNFRPYPIEQYKTQYFQASTSSLKGWQSQYNQMEC